MPGTVVLGTQWGDEGKGKIVDLLAQKADIVVRFQGGANAGHTLVRNGNKVILHLIPSGILWPQTTCLIGPEVVLDPETFLNEIQALENLGVRCQGRLFLSSRTSLIMPYHRELDRLRDNNGKKKIGTTGRGIGPAYEDLVGRRGLQVRDLFANAKELDDKLSWILAEKKALRAHYDDQFVDAHSFLSGFLTLNLMRAAKLLAPFILPDMTDYINTALDADKNILFEGAQGILLDYVNGTYPFVTSSHTHPAAICTSLGVAPQHLTEIIGVTKAYTTRVGEGPFPTELQGEEAEQLRSAGAEYGATTGRPRRCGWLDLPAVRYACRISGVTKIIITKLDVLARQPRLRINNSYQQRGKIVNEFNIEAVAEYVANNEIDFPNWGKDPIANARYFVETVASLITTPIVAASVGAEREEMMWFN